ncbi:MAG: recombinase family protein, partial [Blautia sp.]|nr:recombinase family protein [Blautia sp.]
MKKKVQVGRSRFQEELARPTWSGRRPSAKASDQPVTVPRRVQKVEAAPVEKKFLRVAGYCRVSTDFTEQETSIENQRDHYISYIQSNPDWDLVDIYWEQGVSGTKAETRPELQRLLADCRKGLIDLVITKSISRFSRNTTDCLDMVRNLSSLGVRIIFEKEGIDTGRMESEFLLTLLSAFAENESRSLSSNMKWGIRKRFEAGTYKSAKVPYGYRKTESGFVIDPVESETVRRIFYSFLEGKGAGMIAKELTEEGIPTYREHEIAMRPRDDAERARERRSQHPALEAENQGGEEKLGWCPSTIRKIIRNPFYVGDCIWQKTYVDETYKQRKNNGELDMYMNQDHHDAIISREVFDRANRMLGINETVHDGRRNRYCFSGK